MNSIRFDYSGHCLALHDNLVKSKRVREDFVFAGEEGGGGDLSPIVVTVRHVELPLS